MSRLADHIHNLARNQHGGIMGYLRKPDGRLEGPMPLDVFVIDGRLTSPDIEKLGPFGHNSADRDLGFHGDIVQLDGPLSRALDCGDMLIGLDD